MMMFARDSRSERLDLPSERYPRSAVVMRVASRGSCGGFQRAHADQVVRRRGEEKLPVHAGPATMTELAKSADGLHPPEDLFDAFAHALTDGVAGVPRRPAVERAALLLERDVRCGV